MSDRTLDVSRKLPTEKTDARARILLGMLTPSSNTVLEPVTGAMLADLPHVSAHFGRFRVTEIALSDQALGQFDLEAPLTAARLLGDARCSVIAWNGTSAGWLGLDRDRALCAAIARETGAKATSSTLALADIFKRTGLRRYGMVSPYVDAVQAKIGDNFRQEGWECAGERHLNISNNFAFSEITPATIADMARAVAADKPEAIVIYCTNLWGAPLVRDLEAELGIPVYDSIATVVWSTLQLASIDPGLIRGWGRLFTELR